MDFTLTLISFLIVLAFALFVVLYLALHTDSLVRKQAKWRGKVLTEDLNLTKYRKWAIMFYPIFIGERILFSLFLVLLRDHPVVVSLLSIVLFVTVSEA